MSGDVIVMGIVALVAISGLVWVAEGVRRDYRSIASKGLVLQGLNPHVVEPERFGPSGMARQDEERQRAILQEKKVEAERSRAVTESEDETALREAEDRFFKTMEFMSQGRTNGPPPSAQS
jgi:hypothetical protein